MRHHSDPKPTGDSFIVEYPGCGAESGLPHCPPADDHATLWLDDDGTPALYGIERLDAPEPPYNQWFNVLEFAATWGLEVSVLPKSWYNLGSTVHVVFYPPERYQ